MVEQLSALDLAKQKIKAAVLKEIKQKLSKQELTLVEASLLARMILEELAKVYTLRQLHVALPIYVKKMPLMAEVFQQFLDQLTSQIKTALVNKIEQLATNQEIQKLHQLIFILEK